MIAKSSEMSKEKYKHALRSLDTEEIKSELTIMTIEIGALGHSLPYTCSSLQQ